MSTEKNSLNKIMVNRLVEVLILLGLKKHGMGRKISAITGYSSGQVSNLLSEKDPLNDRFIKSICQGFGINELWLRTGEGEMLSKPVVGEPSDNGYPSQPKIKVLVPAEMEAEVELLLRSYTARCEGLSGDERLEVLDELRDVLRKNNKPPQ